MDFVVLPLPEYWLGLWSVVQKDPVLHSEVTALDWLVSQLLISRFSSVDLLVLQTENVIPTRRGIIWRIHYYWRITLKFTISKQFAFSWRFEQCPAKPPWTTVTDTCREIVSKFKFPRRMSLLTLISGFFMVNSICIAISIGLTTSSTFYESLFKQP